MTRMRRMRQQPSESSAPSAATLIFLNVLNRFQRKWDRPSTINVRDAEFECNCGSDEYFPRALEQIRVTRERHHHASDEFRAFAIGQIQPAGLRGSKDGFRPDETGV
jgi:hypothetical protein